MHKLDLDRQRSENLFRAKPGSCVRFSQVQNGEDWQRFEALRFLRRNGIYRLRRMEVHSSSSYLELCEFPGKQFNTVFFEAIP